MTRSGNSFLETNDAFQQAMLEAIRAHQRGVAMFLNLLTVVEQREHDLQESVDEVKRLTLEQGAQLQALRGEVRQLRDQREGNTQ